ncbi:MAG: transposase [Cytophagaceae bacterium]|nr:transposase [Cytophagaceae bacterium]MBL0327515.1 transposase [Cytophagaceae bacterium]
MENWQEILQEIEQSGLSIAQYCKDNDIKPHTVRYWKQKLVKQKTSGFVKISPGVPSQAMEIIYPSGVRLKLSSRIPIKDLKALLNV